MSNNIGNEIDWIVYNQLNWCVCVKKKKPERQKRIQNPKNI